MTHDKTMDKTWQNNGQKPSCKASAKAGTELRMCLSSAPKSCFFPHEAEGMQHDCWSPPKKLKKHIGWRYQPRKTWKNHEKSCNIPNLVEDMQHICKHCLKPPAKSSYIIKSNLLARGHLKQHSFGESNGNSKVQPSSLQTIQMNPNDCISVLFHWKYLKLVPASEHLEAMLPSALRHKTLPR